MGNAMIDSIIFDLDGTLWDSAAACARCWTVTLAECGTAQPVTREDIASVLGKSPAEICEAWFVPRFGERAEELCRRCLASENPYLAEHGGQLYPMVEQRLRELSKRYRLFIVSNCSAGYIEAFLHCYDFDKLFCGHLCADDTGLTKAQNAELLVQRYALSPVFVGDMESDRACAEAVGCPFLHAAYGFGAVEKADAVLENFDALPGLLMNLERKGGMRHV